MDDCGSVGAPFTSGAADGAADAYLWGAFIHIRVYFLRMERFSVSSCCMAFNGACCLHSPFSIHFPIYFAPIINIKKADSDLPDEAGGVNRLFYRTFFDRTLIDIHGLAGFLRFSRPLPAHFADFVR